MRHVLSIPLKYPYKNELTPSPTLRAYLHFKELSKEWFYSIPKASRLLRQANVPRRLIITRIMGTRDRPFDVPNLYYAAAIIIDTLVKKDWLRDDDPRFLVDVTCNQRKEHGERRTEIIVEDVDLPGPLR